ncbi:hypothetical protein AN189_07375 [Loktanella sp. 3ANDIMAR09]|uniref:hypothetical protein n=1 Tax=Loktanella sp. 3ANDIMAR09 TaxID=1225657 RepID=UPI0006FAF4E9|nr:hypothetical protein [Loktanella sp. 3ANDIMAR09]KQI68712.1 hypothetical protein AN189_07375 [Loktanella sp. 3ANDIMAR09]
MIPASYKVATRPGDLAGRDRFDLNDAQRLILDIVDGGNSLRDYKAPHANRGTPARKHITRASRHAVAFDDDGNVTRISRPRLFKGHRP